MARTLARRLVFSHGALVALVALALVATGQGLLRMLNVIVTVREQQLASLEAEETLHRAGWAVEVAARHGLAKCVAEDPVAAERGMREARERLARTMLEGRPADVVHPAIRNCALRYLGFADRVLEGAPCATLGDPEAERFRFQLDEDMTDAWIDRQREFLRDIVASENDVRGIGIGATGLGFLIAGLAAVVARWVARTTAASVTVPIRRLVEAATHLGEPGAPPVPVTDAPREIVELARALDRTHVRLQEIDGLKRSFLANVSHELRTPLARLREALALLSDKAIGDFSPKQARILTLAQRACDEEVRLVNSLLDLSRLRAGAPIRKQPHVVVEDAVNAALDSEREYARRRGVSLSFDCHAKGASVLADPSLLERAVANLVRNAISVSREGDRVELEVTQEGDELALVVKDRGPGVPAEIRDTLFTPFVAAPVPGFERSLSLGLGLSLAREVARAHGGDLTLVDSTSQGTTFRLTVRRTLEETP